MFNRFRQTNQLRQEWNEKGVAFAKGINDMVALADLHGWDSWKGKEPQDERDHLAGPVLALLRKANKKGKAAAFRADFPPAHAPFVHLLQDKGVSLEQFCCLPDNQIAFIAGTAYQRRQAYVLTGQSLHPLDATIDCIGQSPDKQIFALATDQSIVTYQGWQGPQLAIFTQHLEKQLRFSQLIPFNNGRTLLLVSAGGIYLLTETSCRLIHPAADPENATKKRNLSMEHAAISPDNQWLAVGDQDSEHRVLDAAGLPVAQIGPQSSYPHFALFSASGDQLIANSCHFYNGITIGVSTQGMHGLIIPAYTADARYTVIDEQCRVYVGVAATGYYILGDAYGYIRAFSPTGQLLWRHFLGSTISGMTLSNNGCILWVGTCAGILHQLHLGKGHRDNQTIGTGSHYEDFRILLWKDEPTPLVW